MISQTSITEFFPDNNENINDIITVILDEKGRLCSQWLFNYLHNNGGYSIFIAMEMQYDFKKYGVVENREDWTKRKYKFAEGKVIGDYSE